MYLVVCFLMELRCLKFVTPELICVFLCGLCRSLYGESLVRTPSYEPCSTISETEQTIEKRFLNPDFIAPAVVEVSNEKIIYDIAPGCFPILNTTILNMGPTDTRFVINIIRKNLAAGVGGDPHTFFMSQTL